MTTVVAPDEGLVRAAVDLVWSTMLFATVEPWPSGLDAALADGVRATIELQGDWNGRLALTCPAGLAGEIAGAMIGTAAADLSAEDVHDALGEVVNVVGGTVKGALGGELALGLPDVRPCAADEATDEATDGGFVLGWNGAPIHVQVLAGRP
ncbi:chemotaxis protein CheX [Nocardioides aquiterrae]|uniref:Chemotaxis phosphatase CheX-like domain-containing protein n=1 Tax=Nocardioides aquiterrae TaxID=203799 RepID=A0ABN1UBF7_9ACTN